MTPRNGEAGAAAPTLNRCRCGHFRTAHLRAVPIDPSHPDGGYELSPEGPCRSCGEATCGRFVAGP